MNKNRLMVLLLLLLQTFSLAQNNIYKQGRLLYREDFDKTLANWIIETPPSPASRVMIQNRKLLVDVDAGATVWFNKKLSGNIMITYKRKVLVSGGKNDRLSDFNQFWMAKDPANKNLFTRTGVFSEYDSLLLYYVGFGGNTNKTTRFRKYNGKGERVLIFDLSDQAFLLEPNKTYSITTVVYNGLVQFFVDGKEFFSYRDKDPIKEGYFGFRTTESRQEVDDFRVYGLE
jgi:rhamnogalacturonan endolyase